MIYLLDTNICICHLKLADPAVSGRIQGHLPNDVVLCAVVKAELIYGAFHSAKPEQNMAKVNGFCALFESLPFDDLAAYEYGRIRSFLAGKGTPIGPNDLLIAAIAKAHDLILVTHNVAEFARVPDLRMEDWTKDERQS